MIRVDTPTLIASVINRLIVRNDPDEEGVGEPMRAPQFPLDFHHPVARRHGGTSPDHAAIVCALYVREKAERRGMGISTT